MINVRQKDGDTNFLLLKEQWPKHVLYPRYSTVLQ